MGNITQQRLKDILQSDRYWEVMTYLSSPEFNAQTMCGNLCLQDKVNQYLDNHVKGLFETKKPEGNTPQHINFI